MCYVHVSDPKKHYLYALFSGVHRDKIILSSKKAENTHWICSYPTELKQSSHNNTTLG